MKLGILQQHNTADIANNKTRLAEGIIDLAHRGAELIVLQELHNSLYFCQVEDVELFDLAEPIPGHGFDRCQNDRPFAVKGSFEGLVADGLSPFPAFRDPSVEEFRVNIRIFCIHIFSLVLSVLFRVD